MIKQLMNSPYWLDYKKDIKGIKIGFFAIILASSFTLSIALLHTYQDIKNPKIYAFSIASFVIGFLYKEVCLYFTNKKYKKLMQKE